MKLVNLTPHEINIFDISGENEILTVPVSGKIAQYSDGESYTKDIIIVDKKYHPLLRD